MIYNLQDVIDDTFENSQNRQIRFTKYFKNETNSKLKNMNIQDDSSSLSDSIIKTKNQSFKNLHQQSHLSDLLYTENYENDLYILKDITKKIEKINQSSKQSCISMSQDDSNVIAQKNYNLNLDINYQESKCPIAKCVTITKMNSVKCIEDIQNEQNKLQSQDHILKNKHQRRTQSENKQLLFRLNVEMITKLKLYIMRYYKFHTVNGRTQMITKQIRRTINDYSDIQSANQDNILKYFQLFQYFHHKFKYLTQIPLLNPQNLLCFIIKVLITIINCASLYFYSLIIIFHSDYNYYQQFSFSFSLIWCVDVIIQLNTSFIDQSGQLKERKIILQKYLQENAFFDFIPIIFVNINPTMISIRYIFQAIVFIKIRNIVNDLNYIQKRICMIVKRYYLVQLFNLVFKLFLIGHIIACLWFLIGQIELNMLGFQQTWYDDIKEEINYWWQYYIWSLYWSLTLMTTGSNTANTMLQASFTTIILLFTTISFGYLLNIVSIILSEMDETYQQRRKDINVLNEYMRQKNISQNLQANVNIYLEYYYEKNYKKNYEDNKQALDKLSLDLRNSLLKEYNTQILNNISLLRNNFSSEVLEELTLFMKEEYYQPNQMISKQSENNQNFMIYILSGKIELFENQSKEFMKNSKNIYLGKDEIFGEKNFFSGLSNQTSIKSVEFCKIIKIERENFINIIKQSQKDFEVFCEIKDKILLYKDYSDIYNSCSGCNSKFHFIQDCPYVHFNRQKGFQKSKIQQKQSQSRQNFERSKKIQANALKEASKIQQITLRAKKTFALNHMSTAQRNDLQFQTIEISELSKEDCEQYDSYNHMSNVQAQENQSQNILEGDQYFLKSQANNEFINKVQQNSIHYQEPSIQQKIIVTGSLKSFNEIDDTSEVFRHNNKEKSGQLKLQADSKKKISSDKIKISTKDSFDMLRQFIINELSNTKENGSELDINLGTQNLSPKLKNVKRMSIMKSLKTLNSHLEKEEIKQSLKKSILHLKKIPTTIAPEQQQAENVSNSVISYTTNLINQDDYLNIKDQYNPWEFDSVKEYKHYFVNEQLNSKRNKKTEKKLKKTTQQQKKELNDDSINKHFKIKYYHIQFLHVLQYLY